jgi:hypothetical protein
MLDIGRLAYRVWCGKVCDNSGHALRYDEKSTSSQGMFARQKLDLDC